MEAERPILVVGAGPVGLFMACELHRHGVPCRLIDRAAAPTDATRAAGLAARTVEVLDIAGLADRWVAAGNHIVGSGTYTKTLERISYLSYEEIDSRFAFGLQLEQSQTERMLAEHLDALGETLERRTELRSFTLRRDGVEAELVLPDGTTESAEASYLVGCDGAHSTVRSGLGVSFEGESYPRDFVTADVRIDWELPGDQFYFFLDPVGFMLVFPLLHDRASIVADLGIADRAGPLQGEPTLDELQRLFDERTPGGQLSDPVWKTYYRVHSRQADRYQVGRAFLCGDAAHICSNIGAQGVNTGILDAQNLAWKLALVVRGGAPAELLASYHVERYQAGRAMLELSDQLHRRLLDDPDYAAFRPSRSTAAAESVLRRFVDVLAFHDVVQHRARRALSQLNVGYRHSPIVDEHVRDLPHPGRESVSLLGWNDFGSGPRAGDSATDAPLLQPGQGASRVYELLRDGRHHLLAFAGVGASAAGLESLAELVEAATAHRGDLVAGHLIAREVAPDGTSALLDPSGELHHRYGARDECLYLIRPDAYVAFRSQPIDRAALEDFLERILGPSGRT